MRMAFHFILLAAQLYAPIFALQLECSRFFVSRVFLPWNSEMLSALTFTFRMIADNFFLAGTRVLTKNCHIILYGPFLSLFSCSTPLKCPPFLWQSPNFV